MPRLTDIPDGCAFPSALSAGEGRMRNGPARASSDRGRSGRPACFMAEARHDPRAPNLWSRCTRSASISTVSPPLLERVLERRPRQHLRAVDGVDLDIARGTTFSLVGESGCGKSTIARLVVGLYRPTAGTIRFEGTDLTSRPAGDPPAIRRRMQMIFQDPYASLNPRWRCARHHRRAAEELRHAAGPRGGGARGRASARDGGSGRQGRREVSPRVLRRANASASRSRARSRRSRTSWSATNRRRRSTSRCRRKS